jgi:hypothetical protein
MHLVATNIAIWILVVVQETGYQDKMVTSKVNGKCEAQTDPDRHLLTVIL